MKVLLVTFSGFLPLVLTRVLNPKNEYAPIVVENVAPARKFLSQFGYPENLVYPIYELKECVENFYFDVCICIGSYGVLDNCAYKCNVPKNKFVNLCKIETEENFLLERALRYYAEHSAEFEIFATGMSYTELAILPEKFSHKIFNFGRGTQDLYYDYKIAEFILKLGGGGKIRAYWSRSIQF